MKLEDQVCSLELAKKLLTLGVKQNSLFFHTAGGVVSRSEALPILDSNYSAFTVAELFELLPWCMPIDFTPCQLMFTGGKPYILEYRPIGSLSKGILHLIDNAHDENPANCAAKMLINLIENDFISVRAQQTVAYKHKKQAD